MLGRNHVCLAMYIWWHTLHVDGDRTTRRRPFTLRPSHRRRHLLLVVWKLLLLFMCGLVLLLVLCRCMRRVRRCTQRSSTIPVCHITLGWSVLNCSSRIQRLLSRLLHWLSVGMGTIHTMCSNSRGYVRVSIASGANTGWAWHNKHSISFIEGYAMVTVRMHWHTSWKWNTVCCCRLSIFVHHHGRNTSVIVAVRTCNFILAIVLCIVDEMTPWAIPSITDSARQEYEWKTRKIRKKKC